MKVMAVLSLPRVCFTDNVFCAMHAFQPHGIPVVRRSGAYWSQDISRLLQQGIDEGYDYAFTVDWDSLFGASHVRAMMDIVEDYGHIGALVPLQSRRKSEDEIMYQPLRGAPPHPDPRITEIGTGHFGLTCINLHALNEAKRPWFLGVPDADGNWGDGRTDPDMYFWSNWAESEMNVYLANNVRIGHMQLMTTWPQTDLNPYHVSIERWTETESSFA